MRKPLGERSRIDTVRLIVFCSLLTLGSMAMAVEDSRFAERITVTEVEIPVRVLVDGQPVRGLTAENFELFDRGVPQQILSCEERDLSLEVLSPESPTADYLPDPESSDGRKLLIVFDGAFSRRQYLLRALRGVRTMADSQIHPTDRVAVAVYNGASGLNLVDGFTADGKRITLALDVVEAILSSDRKGLAEAHKELARLTDQQLADGEMDPGAPGHGQRRRRSGRRSGRGVDFWRRTQGRVGSHGSRLRARSNPGAAGERQPKRV
jgi:VWFA-related protein